MTHEREASPAGRSSHEEEVFVPRTTGNVGAYIANPLAGLEMSDITYNVMGPAIGIGSTALGTLLVRKVLMPRLPASFAKFAPLISGVVAALATAPLMLWKKQVGLMAAGTALMLGATLQALEYFGQPAVGAYTAQRLGAYTADRVGALPAGVRNATRDALPAQVNQALQVQAYGKHAHAYGTPYGAYVG